ncbi:MAG: EmrB/QacA family drug resistance transporter [Acidocella sp. 20-57-95]|nr:MAG: EmrB/QacA family drug resistance transporter [Acidocella sp. 20-57-95]OYV58982.1 MAG: EmrB/QacA family drug resistance transporter [Acidocella sp. 21-58-7]HQT63278.1 DHA2 family efflux MFS transporter permease subunit [Acidocella sp.]HQU03761.1 DHA2 family efflux MFS transporter permease subunit [Acidocella sp.]
MPQGANTSTPHRTLITFCLMIATLMQALDSTIANVALPYMQGSVSASYDEITWVLTSYVIAAAIMTAPVGWLTARFGRKNLFIVCLVGFTATSMLCGIADSLVQLVIYRLLQGMFGAALVPLSQSTMLDIYPVEQRGMAMSVWGMGVMVGPILGPTLGGYLTSYYNWRYVFFVNLPFGIVAVTGLALLLPKVKQAATSGFDWLGFGVLSLGLAGLQIFLDRGEELDWFASPEVVVSAILAGLGFYLFTVHVLTARNPFIPRATFMDMNLNAALVTMFSVGMILLASSALLAPYLENLANYPVATAGLIMAPRGIGTMVAMMIAGRLTNKIDPRAIMFAGYVMLSASIYMLEGWTPDVSVTYMTITIMIQGAGLGFVFIPLQVVAFYSLAPALRTQGTALLSLLRNVGSAIGISVTSALLDRQTHYEHAALAQFITPFARPLQAGGAVSHLLNPTTPAGASLLDSMVTTQAQIIAYVDDYKLMLLTMVPAVACLLLMRKPPAAPLAPTAPAHAVID